MEAAAAAGKAEPMTGAAGRFVTEEVLKQKEEQRKEEWDAAYARIGQTTAERVSPARAKRSDILLSLYEKLQENKVKKEEEFETMFKLSAQYRGIDEEESAFLEGMRERERAAEAARNAEAEDELVKYRLALAGAREEPAPPRASTSTAPAATTTSSAKPPAPVKRKPTQRSLLAGAIKKKPASDAAKRRTSEATLDAAKQQMP